MNFARALTPLPKLSLQTSASSTRQASGKRARLDARSASGSSGDRRPWLVEDQRDGLPGRGQPGQDLAGERFHNRIAAHQVVGQKPGNT